MLFGKKAREPFAPPTAMTCVMTVLVCEAADADVVEEGFRDPETVGEARDSEAEIVDTKDDDCATTKSRKAGTIMIFEKNMVANM